MIVHDIRPLLERLNPRCTALLENSVGQCVSREQYEVRFEHFMLAALDEPSLNDIGASCQFFGVDVPALVRALRHELEGLSGGNTAKPAFCPRLLDVLEEAWVISSLQWQISSIRSGAIFAAGIRQGTLRLNDWNRLLEPVSVDVLIRDIVRIAARGTEEDASRSAAAQPAAQHKEKEEGPLGQYCTDFTALARDGRIDTILGRDEEIRQVLDIVSRRRKNNPILVGDAGVGKTAVVEGLALRIAQGDVPEGFAQTSIYELDMGLLQAGAGVKGEFEKRLKSVIDAVKARRDSAILFIDEAHTLIGAGGSAGQNDAANLLKPVLARGELRTIAATTWSEYRRYFEKDPALARRFQLVHVDEPDDERCRLMLRGIASSYEAFHDVVITDRAIEAAVSLSRRFISGRQLPDKAVDVLDTAATRVRTSRAVKPGVLDSAERERRGYEMAIERLVRDRDAGAPTHQGEIDVLHERLADCNERITGYERQWETERDLVNQILEVRVEAGKAPATERAAFQEQLARLTQELSDRQGERPMVFPAVSAAMCAQVIGDWTSIPVGSMMRNEAKTLLELEERLAKRIVGQDDALSEVCSMIRAAKSGMRSPDAPLGVFLFAGPSGVGKTECALALADELFGGEKFLTIINMSEYREQHTASQLKGSPPGYVGYGEGGVLTEAVRQKPYSVVLLDEVEKAHRDVLNLFYQVFDKGVMRDGEGREINFRNTVIIMTSNLGSDTITAMCSGEHSVDSLQLCAAIRSDLLGHFQPALLGRCRVVPFLALGQDALERVVRLKTDRIAQRITDAHGMGCVFSEAAVKAISEGCTVRESGARDIDTVLEQQILPCISRCLLERLGEDDLIDAAIGIDCDDEGTFRIVLEVPDTETLEESAPESPSD